jgi:hypothetical protein
MAATTKAMLEAKYNVPVYVRWHLVPHYLETRKWFLDTFGVKIPKSAQPDGIKGGGQMMGKPKIFFLFDKRKYLQNGGENEPKH